MPGSDVGNPRYMLAGDPGFFALLAAGRLIAGKIAGKVAAARAGAVASTAMTRVGRIALPTITTVSTVGTIGQVGAAVRRGVAGRKVAVAGVATAAATAGALMLPGERRRFRRMNPLNPKALKRATRRLAGFHGFATSTQRELSKLCPPKRSAARKAPCR